MNTKLWVDDLRNPPDDTYDIARTYDDAIMKLQANEYTSIYLDHDLACYRTDGREMTGYDVVMWLVEQKINNNLRAPQHYHMLTSNPEGRRAMIMMIERYLLD